LLIVFLIIPVAFLLLAAALCRVAGRPTPHPTDEDVEKSFDDLLNYGGTDD
jgi:hypothetical protein